MDNYGGDLADIIRTGGTINASTIDMPAESSDYDHHQLIHHNRQIDQYRLGFDMEDDPLDEFGDPFSLLLQDPLNSSTTTHDHDDSTSFFNNVVEDSSIINQSGRRIFVAEADEDSIFRQPNISNNTSTSLFTRMFDLVDSPNSTKSSAVMKSDTTTTTSPMLAVNDVVISNNSNSNSINGGGVQISSPRNTAGIKRRKSQSKKVVCIPAPAPVNSRPSGEVVPSDLWAWRKYGQKPIKGSPYPRGYYRCSSCKGCPARKQVERNRTDPNMLVITYTCEHNHPWPTQRNALAGSTRTTHPSRSGSGSNSKITPTNSSSNSQSTHKQPNNHLIQQELQITNHDKLSSPPRISSSVKEEMEIEDHVRFSQVFQQSAYKPGFVDETSHSEDFFAELGELEADPMNILFPNGYSEVDDCENKSLDPFTFYDWASNNNKNNNNNKDYLVRPEEKKGS